MLAKERLAKIGLGVRLKKEVLPPESVKSILDPIRKKMDDTKSFGTPAKKKRAATVSSLSGEKRLKICMKNCIRTWIWRI